VADVMALWYASRATGVLALLLLTGTAVLGVLSAGRATSGAWPRFAVGAVHRNLSLLTVTFVAVHVMTAIVDGYAGIAWLDAVVPFVSAYHPFWLGLGAVAFDLLLALLVTSLLRTRVGPRTWRAVHWAAYACWPVAVVHALGIGESETRSPLGIAAATVCVLTVVIAVAWRAGTTSPDQEARTR
jgi:DMSO/TMAO reductase YedYZ heme-binding membrane subunit